MNIYEEVKNYKQFYDKIEKALRELVDRYKDYFSTDKKDRIFIQ